MSQTLWGTVIFFRKWAQGQFESWLLWCISHILQVVSAWTLWALLILQRTPRFCPAQLTLQVCEYQSWCNGGGGTDLTCCKTTSKIADFQPGKFPGPAHVEEPGTQNKSWLLMKCDCNGREQFYFSALTMPLAYLRKYISSNSFYL